MATVPASATVFRGLPAADSKDFLPAVKELLEVIAGQRGNGLDRAVTVRDLSNERLVGYLNNQAASITQNGLIPEDNSPFADTTIPDPPTDLLLMKSVDAGRISAFENLLTWTNPVSDIVSLTEVWVSEDNVRSHAARMGVVTYPGNEYAHGTLDPTKDYFYWIRSVSFAGQASTWEPAGSTDGYVVPGDEAVKDTISRVLNTLIGESPAAYNAGTTYYEGNRVSQVGDDGGTRAYECIDDDGGSGITGVAPTDTDHWKRSGVLVGGDIDGVYTQGIDGNMVVDGTILAEKLQVDELSAVTADLGTVTAGVAKDVAGEFVIDFNNAQLVVTDDSDVIRVKLGKI